jgi:hypothetical protein
VDVSHGLEGLKVLKFYLLNAICEFHNYQQDLGSSGDNHSTEKGLQPMLQWVHFLDQA